MNEQAWQAKLDAARKCYSALMELAETPLDVSVEIDQLLNQWTALAHSMNVNEIEGDPRFAAPYLDELKEMNLVLRDAFLKRKSALSDAQKHQQKVQAGIKAYHKQS